MYAIDLHFKKEQKEQEHTRYNMDQTQIRNRSDRKGEPERKKMNSPKDQGKERSVGRGGGSGVGFRALI
jgi:hypothetical protein